MMTAQRLVGLAERLEWDALLGAVIRNGRPVALPVRVRLSEESGACGSALGLALCRAVELTYLPGPESHSLAMLALGSQLEDGSFGSVAGTACAAAGLRVYEEQLRAGLGDAALIARVAEASDRAVMALMEMMRGSRRRSVEGVDVAVVLWALAGRERAGERWWMLEMCATAEAMGLTHDASLSGIVAPALIRSGAVGAKGMGVAA